jgi:hypothetical protein
MVKHRLKASRSAFVALLAGASLLAGCGAGNGFLSRRPAEEPLPAPTDRNIAPSAVQAHFELIQQLVQAEPAAQVALLNAVRLEAENSRLATHRLRHALLLGTPGHDGHDPEAASQIMRDILSVPATLQPPERALAAIEIQRIQQNARLFTENKRLREELERSERDRNSALNRRLQAEVEENARLKKALEEARAKLDAISNIERATTGRKP